MVGVEKVGVGLEVVTLAERKGMGFGMKGARKPNAMSRVERIMSFVVAAGYSETTGGGVVARRRMRRDLELPAIS